MLRKRPNMARNSLNLETPVPVGLVPKSRSLGGLLGLRHGVQLEEAPGIILCLK